MAVYLIKAMGYAELGKVYILVEKTLIDCL